MAQDGANRPELEPEDITEVDAKPKVRRERTDSIREKLDSVDIIVDASSGEAPVSVDVVLDSEPPPPNPPPSGPPPPPRSSQKPPPVTGESDSVDSLLALTNEDLDFEDQRSSLQEAARKTGSHRPVLPPVRDRLPSVEIPTAVELAVPESGQPSPSAAPPGRSAPTPPIGRPSGRAGARAKRGQAGSSLPPPLPASESAQTVGALPDLLSVRISTLEAEDDKVGLARAHVEMAIACETILGDEARARMHAESALRVEPRLAAAHGFLRQRTHGRGAIGQILEHLEHEIAAATEEVPTVALLVEKARLLEAQGESPARIREIWEQALTRAPVHAAALKGLEGTLAALVRADGSPDAYESLAAHLGRMADAYGDDPQFAAWLHVERAQVLEWRLGKIDTARGALERAVELDPGIGPVRDACVRYVAAHNDASALAALLDEEARLEKNVKRAARLEFDAAMVVSERLDDRSTAIQLLARAASRAPTDPGIDRRVLDELIRLHEIGGEYADAARARRARLPFMSEPQVIAYELRVLARIGERLHELDVAIADIDAALKLEPADPTLAETMDRLLQAADRDADRITFWLAEAERQREGHKRARCLLRAAQIAENHLKQPSEAIRHLRAAWASAPGDPEIFDHLSRLLAPRPSESMANEARGLLDLYGQAAEATTDAARKTAYLEKIAVIKEEMLGDAKGAAAAYEEILRHQPERRSAILGLARTAARAKDDRALARALLDEARNTTNESDVIELRVRAASALARVDAARALALVEEVLETSPAHEGARQLETRLHEEANRWERAASSLSQRISHAQNRADKVSLWLALAQLQDTKLRSHADALASLKQARTLDPKHPVPPEEITRLLEARGDFATLRSELEALAKDATAPEDRVRYLTRAAEIDELRLGDDRRAALLYARALAESPDDELVAERMSRVLARAVVEGGAQTRVARLTDLATLQAKRVELTEHPEAVRSLSFDLALLLVEIGKDLPRASRLLDAVLSDCPDHIGALRALEALARRASDPVALARAVSRQAEASKDKRATLGALWSLATLEEWKLPAADTTATYRRILSVEPNEPAALSAVLSRELSAARRGDSAARETCIAALRALFPVAADDGTRLAIGIRLALMLELAATEARDEHKAPLLAEALDRYRGALHVDDVSLTAASGLARCATALRDVEGAVAAATALAELTAQPRTRARYLVEAAELLLGDDTDDALGDTDDRRRKARSLLERALEADPDSVPAAGRLAILLTEDGRANRLVDVLRAAIKRARSSNAIVMLAAEIARVARDDLGDLELAIEAMRRAREASPTHVPTLLTLSELCIAERQWAEAVDVLESIVAGSRESGPRLTALFALASVYERVLGRPSDAERALRSALAIDATSPRALKALVRHMKATRGGTNEMSHEDRREIAKLLGDLADVEKDATERCALWLELAETQLALGDKHEAENALIEAVAHTPHDKEALSRLRSLFGGSRGMDHAAYAGALAKVIKRGKRIGQEHPPWLAMLGEIELDSLGRPKDAILHLKEAIELDGEQLESQYHLARAYTKAGANEETIRTVVALLEPMPTPLLKLRYPTRALALLEEALNAEQRREEALVISELRAIGGDLDEGRNAWLRSRRLKPLEAHHSQLDRPALVTHVLPPEGRHVLLEVAAAVAGIESKILRADLSEIGISSRDRISARSGHPTRALLDRLMRTLGLTDIDLVVSPQVTRTRVLAQDTLWVVIPQALAELPEPTQLASLARALTRISLGVPWLEELPPPHVEALLIACARQVVHGYAADDLDVLSGKLVAQYEPTVSRAISRRHKRLLEELAPHISAPQGRPIRIDAFVSTLSRAELRGAALITGDLLASLDELRGLDATLYHATDTPGPRALAAVLDHPFGGDVCRFALSPEAIALRRRIGSTWAS